MTEAKITETAQRLVKLCADAGIEVTAIPGPSVVVTALALSALPAGRFTFEGFLPVEKKERRERLNELKDERRTMIFYEAPHKLAATLADMSENFGEQRPVSLSAVLHPGAAPQSNAPPHGNTALQTSGWRAG